MEGEIGRAVDEGRGLGLPLQPQLQVVAVDAEDREAPDLEAPELHFGIQLVVQRVDQGFLKRRRGRERPPHKTPATCSLNSLAGG